MAEMEYANFLFDSLQEANAEIRRSHDEIERLKREKRNAARECIEDLHEQRDELLKRIRRKQ